MVQHGIDLLPVLSNLMLLFPMIRAIQLQRWTRAALYFLVVCASSLFHACIAYYTVCVFPYTTQHHLDFFFAFLQVPLSALYLVDFAPHVRWLERWLIILCGVGIFSLQSLGVSFMYIQGIVVGSSFFGLVFYWICFPHVWKTFYKLDALTTGILLTLLSCILFASQAQYLGMYWALHSAWHMLGASGQYYLLGKYFNPPPLVFGQLTVYRCEKGGYE